MKEFGRKVCVIGLGLCLPILATGVARADEAAPPEAARLGLREMIDAGGVIGWLIMALSVAMVALIVEHAVSIRRNALIPPNLSDKIRDLVAQRQIRQAEQECQLQPSYLSEVLASGLSEVNLGYSAVEKAMEDRCEEQSARLLRKIDYLQAIGTLAPMLGLLGTVWGMMVAFHEFVLKANPQPSDLAPGIYKALVTTLMGLSVAVPALAAFVYFRNRIDEFGAEASLEASRAFVDFKRSASGRKGSRKAGDPLQPPGTSHASPVAVNRDPAE